MKTFLVLAAATTVFAFPTTLEAFAAAGFFLHEFVIVIIGTFLRTTALFASTLAPFTFTLASTATFTATLAAAATFTTPTLFAG